MIYKNRKSIRLKNYDYTRAGLYFITICANHRQSIFGYIDDGVMMLNDAGRMIEKWYVELENKFEKIKCHQMVVMPNHFHCIIEIVDVYPNPVGANLCVRPNGVHPNIENKTVSKGHTTGNQTGRHAGLPLRGMDDNNSVGVNLCVDPNRDAAPKLNEIVQWFKTMTTNEYIRGVKNSGWQPFDKKMWQRNYWEHIIRNEQSYIKLLEYIENNPLKWDMDKLHPDNAEALNVK